MSGDLPASTYTTNLKGTTDAPIWITGEPGAKIGLLTLESASSIVVQDLELANSPDGHILHFFFADHLLFRRLTIHDAGMGCIKGSQTTDAYVEDSDLFYAGKVNGHPTIDYVGVNGGHIVRSKFHDGPGVMIMLKGGTSDMFFAWNEIYAQTAVSLNADPGNHGPGNVIDYNVFLKPGGLNWWGDIAQDMMYSTYTEDPQVSQAGIPGNTALVDGKGPPDLGAIPFSNAFVRDYAGNCIMAPTDIGAFVVP